MTKMKYFVYLLIFILLCGLVWFLFFKTTERDPFITIFINDSVKTEASITYRPSGEVVVSGEVFDSFNFDIEHNIKNGIIKKISNTEIAEFTSDNSIVFKKIGTTYLYAYNPDNLNIVSNVIVLEVK